MKHIHIYGLVQIFLYFFFFKLTTLIMKLVWKQQKPSHAQLSWNWPYLCFRFCFFLAWLCSSSMSSRTWLNLLLSPLSAFFAACDFFWCHRKFHGGKKTRWVKIPSRKTMPGALPMVWLDINKLINRAGNC